MPNHYTRIDLARGYAKPASPEDIAKDQSADGITMPNLHRRIDPDAVLIQDDQVAKDQYAILVNGVDSYRSIEHFYYSDTDSEITITGEFTGDGAQTEFVLRPTVIEIVEITVNGTEISDGDYSLDKPTNTVTFNAAPAIGAEIVITYKMISEIP